MTLRLSLTALCATLVLSAAAASRAADAAPDQPNVLFIAVDDLRPQLGAYGHDRMHTPNIDRLAESGTVFERAYCMVPTCGASRSSLMTGVRPSRNRFVRYNTWAEKDAPGVPALNDHFKRNGYRTISVGKVFHHPGDHADGWSEKPWRPPDWMGYQLEKNLKLLRDDNPTRGRPYEAAERPERDYPDGKTAAKALEHMRDLSERGKPWFLAVGFLKPHLPFCAPQKYWDLYDPENVHIPPNYRRPIDAPDAAMHNFGELRAYHNVPETGPVSDAMARRMIHGYYACVSFADAQVGKLLDALERHGMREDTIVVLWGDHGWQLGEHGLWCKHCEFETSMHAPLLVRVPWMNGGRRTDGLTEFIDIYPSLCDLAGLPKPGHLDGRSFAPLMKDPDRPWKKFAIGRFRNGDTIRTDRYRYSQYSREGGEVFADMLYDHWKDPGENFNIAGRERMQPVTRRLGQLLQEHKGKDGRFE